MKVRRSIGAAAFCVCGAIGPTSALAQAGQGSGPGLTPQTGATPTGSTQVTSPQSTSSTNPLQPSGFPNPTPKGLPEPVSKQPHAPGDPDGQEFHLIRSGAIAGKGDNAELTGGVEFTYQGYHVTAQTATWNRVTHTAVMAGDVKILTADSIVKGQRIIVDFDHKSYIAYDADSQISPSEVKGQIKAPLYVKGRESSGTSAETLTLDSDLTTCDLEHPHWDITGENTIVRPGHRAIFRRARIRLFGRTILKIPFLSIPLDDRTYNNLPSVGQDPTMGYYILTHYAFPWGKRDEVQTRLDYMSNLGVGYGINYIYHRKTSEGFVKFYAINGPWQELLISNEHKQVFSWGSITVDTDYQKNNFLTAPGTTLLNNKVALAFPRRDGSTQLTFSRNENDSSGFGTVSQSIAVSDTRTLIKDLKTTVNLNYLDTSQKSEQTSTDTQTLSVLFRASDEFTRGTANLDYQRTIPIGSSPNFFSGSDRTPELTFDTDATKLIGKKFNDILPFRAEASIGEFQEYTGDHVSRESIDLNFQKYDKSTKPLHADFTGEFRQGFYSDNTAQYILNFGTNISYKFGRDTAATFRYNYLRPYGYSPLQQDQTGITNLATMDVSYRPVPSLLIGGQTGYDISRLQEQVGSPWQQVGIRSEWTPQKWFMFRTLSTYDTIDGDWSNIRLDLGYQPGASLITFGSQYDGVRKVWSIANMFINNFKVGKTMLSGNFSYNGYTDSFDSYQLSAIYDLHCAEAVFTYSEFNTGFRPGRTVNFFIRLKAFPFDSPFGHRPTRPAPQHRPWPRLLARSGVNGGLGGSDYCSGQGGSYSARKPAHRADPSTPWAGYRK